MLANLYIFGVALLFSDWRKGFLAFLTALLSAVSGSVPACAALAVQSGFRIPTGCFLLPAPQKLWDWEMALVILASCHFKADIALCL